MEAASGISTTIEIIFSLESVGERFSPTLPAVSFGVKLFGSADLHYMDRFWVAKKKHCHIQCEDTGTGEKLIIHKHTHSVTVAKRTFPEDLGQPSNCESQHT